MNSDLEQQLYEDFPDYFTLLDKEPDEIDGPVPPLAIYGITCGDGWYDIIHTLCEELDRADIDLTVVQVKEKFGGLRFYHNGVSAEEERHSWKAMGMIRFAEAMSLQTCEQCGSPGSREDDGWLRTLCSDCREAEE